MSCFHRWWILVAETDFAGILIWYVALELWIHQTIYHNILINQFIWFKGDIWISWYTRNQYKIKVRTISPQKHYVSKFLFSFLSTLTYSSKSSTSKIDWQKSMTDNIKNNAIVFWLGIRSSESKIFFCRPINARIASMTCRRFFLMWNIKQMHIL